MKNIFGDTAHINNYGKLIYQNTFYALWRNVRLSNLRFAQMLVKKSCKNEANEKLKRMQMDGWFLF